MITIRATYDGTSGSYYSKCPKGYRPISASVEDRADGRILHHYAPDEAPVTSPTDADIDRRVQLLREAAAFHELPFTTPRDYCTVDGRFYRRRWAESTRTEWCETDEATFTAGLRATAIRELLRERGGK